ncbi:hypothetical protein [Xenorhabdus japonica]|uniref:Uncharacterized protein n=1 Tax=Xenorhabdus japonica TaxID=53341 RepID=A0A1I5BDC5_9GAMM|nr:hypothetical protein [Xenorhabdus japonica]SFN72714.1 hypothetical protein SAMN05421579_1182 [Xenorhabdus japonica]
MSSREQFEKWLTETYPWSKEELEKAFFHEEYQYYVTDSDELSFTWEGWRGRSNTPVELPSFLDCDDDDELRIEYNRGIFSLRDLSRITGNKSQANHHACRGRK